MNRRELLLGAGALCGSQILAAQTGSPARKRKIIVTGGHPGDPEYGCGGTVARMTALGHDVVLLYLNDGAWPPTPANVRLQEAKSACSILGARPLWASQQNGHAILDNDHYQAFQQVLAAERPDAVFTHWPMDLHRDHRAMFNLVFDSWNEAKRNFSLYFYEVSDGEDTLQFAPSVFVDIDTTEQRKRAACYAHASQTPDRYYELQDAVARFRGLQAGYARAEGFVPQQQNPGDLFAEIGLATHG